MTDSELSRRNFVKQSAVALTAMATGGFPLSARNRDDASPLNIGIIGCGHRGSGIAGIIRKLPGMQLCACCDLQEENLKKGMVFAAPGGRAYVDCRSLLDDQRIDAVIIALPLYLHYPVAKAALQAGKHVYLEKTMTYTISEALQLEKEVRNRRLVLQVGHQYRYFEMYRKVKEILSQNWLGTVTRVDCQYHNHTDWRFPVADPQLERLVNWRMYREYSGGLMAELCSHQVDLMNWMLDATPLKVTGLGAINYYRDGRECFDSINVVYQYPQGVNAIFSALLSNSHNGYFIRILGTKGALEISRDQICWYPEPLRKEKGTLDGVTGATLPLEAGGGRIIPYGSPDRKLPDPTVAALTDFGYCIREGRTPFSNVQTGKDAAIAIHMANEAIESESCQYWNESYSE